jgi:hypothetical protein
LEGVNTPRARAVEAHKLMQVFADFLDDKHNDNDVTDLVDSADVIQKLCLIAHELPIGHRFDLARERIQTKYDYIERQLIEEFVRAHRIDDRRQMRQMATTLAHFKGYSQCVDAFIETAQSSHKDLQHVFQEIPGLCARNERLIKEVFPNADHVFAKFVLNVFHGRLQELIHERLSVARDHLHELHDLHVKTTRLARELETSLGCDPMFLQKITKNMFSRFLNDYIKTESQSLREKCQQILNRFYDSRGHHKRPLPQTSIQEFKRDIQFKMGSLVKSGQEDSLLSEEVAIGLLQETKLALQRCQALSRSQELSQNALTLFEIETHFLVVEHLDYALEVALQSIAETKSQPELQFLDCVRQCNAICHLMEKQFVDCVLPLVVSTAKHGECLKRKRELSDGLETKVNAGL